MRLPLLHAAASVRAAKGGLCQASPGPPAAQPDGRPCCGVVRRCRRRRWQRSPRARFLCRPARCRGGRAEPAPAASRRGLPVIVFCPMTPWVLPHSFARAHAHAHQTHTHTKRTRTPNARKHKHKQTQNTHTLTNTLTHTLICTHVIQQCVHGACACDRRGDWPQ